MIISNLELAYPLEEWAQKKWFTSECQMDVGDDNLDIFQAFKGGFTVFYGSFKMF
jgi:hypothetical protein